MFSAENNFSKSFGVGPFGIPPNMLQKPEPYTGNSDSQRSLGPVTTGTSVIGVKYNGGVVLAADNLISYGSMARYTDIERVFKVNEKSVIGAGGDYGDFQYLKKHIDKRTIEDLCYDDGIVLKPKSLYNWLTRILYNRRSNMNPLWLELVVGGMQDDKPFLGCVDLRGKSYEDDIIATGFGKHMALPLLRGNLNGKLVSKQEAIELVKKTMEVLFYRDARSHHEFTIAVCDKDGSYTEGPIAVKQDWEMGNSIEGY